MWFSCSVAIAVSVTDADRHQLPEWVSVPGLTFMTVLHGFDGMTLVGIQSTCLLAENCPHPGLPRSVSS